MKWTNQAVSKLPVRDGYQLRGEEMTRIEVFSDAAFAFAVTMLVISLSGIPQSYGELMKAMQRIPSFAASFAVITVVWVGHRRWSRRFGLDDGVSTFLTLSLIFIVLVYVYPLKIIMDLMFMGIAKQWFPSDFQVSNTSEVAGLVAIFSIGFCLIALIHFGLYRTAASKKEDLCLDRLECELIRKEQLIWLIQAITGLLVALISLVFISSWGYLAGILFSVIPIAIHLATLKIRKNIKDLENGESSSNE